MLRMVTIQCNTSVLEAKLVRVVSGFGRDESDCNSKNVTSYFI
jgi:hypothetical protein